MKNQIIFLLVSVSICTGCTAVHKHRSPESIIATQKLGTNDRTVEAWRQRMEAEGFKCEMIENGTFTTTYKKKQRIDNTSFLRCRRETEAGIDDVALVVEEGVVTDEIVDFESK